ncbi:MAG: hypothetical protein LBE84_01300, partial [Planctomycetota bacterium]|nr:hypothetical protein [Planctomycetota bacterium]
GLGENRFKYAHESNDLWKLWHGDFLLQGVCSTPSKRIAMPLFNLCRKLQPQNFQKSTIYQDVKVIFGQTLTPPFKYRKTNTDNKIPCPKNLTEEQRGPSGIRERLQGNNPGMSKGPIRRIIYVPVF